MWSFSVKACLLFAAALVFLNPVSALAQAAADAGPNQGISLQISPLPIELTTKPGTSVSTDLRVRNNGSKDEKLQVRLLKVSSDDNGVVKLSAPTPEDPWTQWVHFSKSVFDAPTGQWQTINMRIDVPKTAAFGYYFAVEYLRYTAEPPQPGKAVARGAVATFILLNADAPGAVREAKLDSFSADKKSYNYLPVNFTAKVRSTGNVHVAPRGNIFITKGKKQIGSIPINATSGNILPSSARFFASSWADGFPIYKFKYNGDSPAIDKNGDQEKSLTWDFTHANRLRFGHYTAHLVMVYDNGQRDVPMEGYVSFWVIPWILIIIGLFVLAMVVVGIGTILFKGSRVFKGRGRKSKTKYEHRRN
jgi:hypothetical protein